MKQKMFSLICAALLTVGIFTPAGTPAEAATTYYVKVTTNSLTKSGENSPSSKRLGA
ncbi:MAG: hypothetical protein IKE23_00465 [Exiguobacterium sp.]|nr:hypothetical protein [Exiguobacterium sp.]